MHLKLLGCRELNIQLLSMKDDFPFVTFATKQQNSKKAQSTIMFLWKLKNWVMLSFRLTMEILDILSEIRQSTKDRYHRFLYIYDTYIFIIQLYTRKYKNETIILLFDYHFQPLSIFLWNIFAATFSLDDQSFRENDRNPGQQLAY